MPSEFPGLRLVPIVSLTDVEELSANDILSSEPTENSELYEPI